MASPGLPDGKVREMRFSMRKIQLVCVVSILGTWGFQQVPASGEGLTADERQGYTPKPLPAGTDAFTSADLARQRLGFTRRASLGIYKKTAPKGAAGYKKGLAFLEMWYEQEKKGSPSPESRKQLMAAAKAATEAGCKDPVFLYHYARNFCRAGQKQEAILNYKRACELLENSPYPKVWRYWASGYLKKHFRQADDQKQWKHYKHVHWKCMYSLLTDHSFYQKNERRLYYAQMCWGIGNSLKRMQYIYDCIKDRPGADPWLLNLLGGRLEDLKAWKARGGGWAHQVKEKDWTSFGEHLAKAREHYIKAWELAPDTPEAPKAMIGIAMAAPTKGETPRMWFDRSVASHLDYMRAYSSMRWALRPRWGGSRRQMLAFARECLETKRFDTYVPYQMFETVKNIAEDFQGDVTAVLSLPGVTKDLIRMFDGYCQVESSKNWALCGKAALAWKQMRWREARKYLDQCTKIDPKPFKGFGADPGQAMGEIRILTGDFGEEVQSANKLYDEGKYAEALAKYTGVADRENSGDKAVGCYLKNRIWRARSMDRLSKGEWADLLPDSALTGWRIRSGKWEVRDGVLVGSAAGSGLLLYTNLPIGERFEIKARIEFERTEKKIFNGGIILRCTRTWTHSFLGLPNYGRVRSLGAGTMRKGKDVGGVSSEFKKINDIHVRIYDGIAAVRWNGKKSYAPHRMDGWAPGIKWKLNLGGWYGIYGVQLRYSELKVRLLKKPLATDVP